MWKLLTIYSGKTVISLLRLFNRHATALPGLIAEQLYPNLLEKMVRDIPGGVIIVTGTNGKTTTAKILRKLLASQGMKVLANKSGSNFTRGILSSLIEHADSKGKLNYDIAIMEVDEAYTPIIAAATKPKVVVILNVMRDQLDRYGEIDHTVKTIGRSLEHAEGAVINLDDLPLRSLIGKSENTTTFGAAEKIRKLLPSDEELHAKSSRKVIKPEIVLTDFNRENGLTSIDIKLGKHKATAKTRLEGVHNYLNITAALATIKHLRGGVEPAMYDALSLIKPAFGRGERLRVYGHKVHLALVKNPSGFNQNIRSFMTDKVGAVLFVINDRYADGRDVSWLWDIDLGPLRKSGAKAFASGIRAYDMGVRLQHEGVEPTLIEPKFARALRHAVKPLGPDQELLILPTYTAMLEARKLLLKLEAEQ